MVKIELTDEQAKELSDSLHDYCDEGPEGEGWASSELRELREIVDNAIAESKK